MIGAIFYAFGLIILVSLISNIFRYRKVSQINEWYSKYEKITGKSPKEEDFRSKSEWQLFQSTKILNLFEFSWLIIGLLSKSWLIFGATLLTIWITGWTTSSIQFSIVGKSIKWLVLVLKSATVFFLIINHFHLHINLSERILGFIF